MTERNGTFPEEEPPQDDEPSQNDGSDDKTTADNKPVDNLLSEAIEDPESPSPEPPPGPTVTMGGGRDGEPPTSTPQQAFPPLDPDERSLHPGQIVDGKYKIVAEIGRGGEGKIYEAIQISLEKRVVLKVLHRRDPERIKKEAVLLASIVHPNVVRVSDVAESYLVADFVEGVTLKEWLAEADRSQGEIVDAFGQVARGLQAVHEAGLIHRDFKLSNAMVDRRGQVIVVDFGLASAVDEAHDEICGTPYYVAPEQAEGHAVQTSDQFSLCVALYRALYSDWPYNPEAQPSKETRTKVWRSGDPSNPLAAFIDPGPLAPRPNKAGFPYKAVCRGLEKEASRRHASMVGLVEGLEKGRSELEAEEERLRAEERRRKNWTLGAALVTLALLISSWAAERWVAPYFDPRLQAVTKFGKTLTQERMAKLLRIQEPELLFLIEAYEARWVELYIEVARRPCLLQRQRELAAFLSTNAAELAPGILLSGLEELRLGLEGCEDPSDPYVRPDIEQAAGGARKMLALGEAQRLAGDFEAANASTTSALEEAQELPHLPLVAEAQLQLGKIYVRQERNLCSGLEQARRVLRQAAETASVARHLRAFAEARLELLYIASVCPGNSESPFQQAKALVGTVENAIRELRFPGDLRAELLAKRGILMTQMGEPREALVYCEAALKLHIEFFGPLDTAVGTAHYQLADAYAALGEIEREREHLEAALEIYRASLGEAHSRTREVKKNLGLVLMGLDVFPQACEFLKENDPYLLGLGPCFAASGRMEEAFASAREARRLAEDLPPDFYKLVHPRLLQNLAYIHSLASQSEEALLLYDEAVKYLQDQTPEDPKSLAEAYLNQGEELNELGRSTEADSAFEEALRLCHSFSALDPRCRGIAHAGRAKSLLAQDRLPEATEEAQKAQELLIDRPVDASTLAEVLLVLANISERNNHDSGCSMAKSAERLFATRRQALRRELEKTRVWLNGHDC